MTKVQAYVLARQELWSKAVTAKEVRNRAIEIYAAEFAEWTQENGFLKSHIKLWFCMRYSTGKAYTITELIAEFEKQQ